MPVLVWTFHEGKFWYWECRTCNTFAAQYYKTKNAADLAAREHVMDFHVDVLNEDLLNDLGLNPPE